MPRNKESESLVRRLRRERRRSVLKVCAKLLLILVLSLLTAVILFGSVTVQESSMSPTLQAGDKVFVNRAAYAVGGVSRGDVIAYKGSSSVDTGIHIKRVIGLPGETVTIRDGLILIDGNTYIESRDFPNITNPGLAAEGIRLGGDEYFVLGDNRNNSEDSRFADVGNILKADIVGKVWFRGQPMSALGFVK